MQDLSVTLLQSSLHWENTVANLAMFEEKIWSIQGKTDVIVLPEMFTTGFTMNANAVAEMMGLQTTKWMTQMADQTGALILGSFIAKEKGLFYNRLLGVQPGGNYTTYDKRHLFRMGQEHTVFASGNQRVIISWKGWNICPFVCYDLRFPVWSRNQWSNDQKRMLYDVLIYVANWPQARINAWDTLLRARAIENLSYAVGVNRIGVDGVDVAYNGHLAVIDPRGETVHASEDQDLISTVNLDAGLLQTHRTKFPAYLDSDDFSINP